MGEQLTSDFRNPILINRIALKIAEIAPRNRLVKICHVCGTHEYTITHFGLRALLPSNVDVIAGPGCPVCIIPASEVDEAVQIAQKGVTVACFGDVIRVPSSKSSLLEVKADGGDIRVVYSLSDAIGMARREKEKQFVFFAVGFETTAPSTAVEILAHPPPNLSFLISHRLIPPAMRLLANDRDLSLEGFIAPGHVSTVIGLEPYSIFPLDYGIPTIVAGFEPLDVMMSIYMILEQLKKRRYILENEYSRVVHQDGNFRAQEYLNNVFIAHDGGWRGIGAIPRSKLLLRKKYRELDAREIHDVRIDRGVETHPGCRCASIIIGKIKPTECSLFMKACTPQNPVGACMVGTEGTCRIWATIGRSECGESRACKEL